MYDLIQTQLSRYILSNINTGFLFYLHFSAEHVQEYEAQMWTFENCWKSFFLNNFASVQYSNSEFTGIMDNHVTYDLSYFLYQNILLQQSLDKKVTLFHFYPTKRRHEKITAFSNWNIAFVVNVYWPYVTLHWVTLINTKKR